MPIAASGMYPSVFCFVFFFFLLLLGNVKRTDQVVNPFERVGQLINWFDRS